MTDQPQHPSYALIDIEAGQASLWQDVLVLARLHRNALEHLRLQAQPKVTGGHGIQIWVPINRGPSFTQTRQWVRRLSKTIAAVVPELVSLTSQGREQGATVRLGHTQNALDQTQLAPYSTRAAPGAPVSAPISWDELDDPSLRPDGFTLRTLSQRLAERGDLFRPLLHADQELPPLD